MPAGLITLRGHHRTAALTANLFLNAKVDVEAVQAVADAGFVWPITGTSRLSFSLAVGSLWQTLLDFSRRDAKSSARELLAYTSGGYLPEDHVLLEDIRQIKGKGTDGWRDGVFLPSEPLRYRSLRVLGLPAGKQELHPFWTDWYSGVFEGQEQDWALVHDIALIDDAVWRQGDAVLDTEISRHVERHRLLGEVRRLSSEQASALAADGTSAADAAQVYRGHNNPAGTDCGSR